MRILFLIILNSFALYFWFKYLNIYGFGLENIAPITMWCINEMKAFCDIRSYFMLASLISSANLLVLFVFRKINLPDFFITKFIWIFVSTTLIFSFFAKIMEALQVSMLSYNINGITNFVIIVAIFWFLNTLYCVIFIK